MRLVLACTLALGVIPMTWAEEATSKLPPLPTAVSSFGAAVVDGHVYVYGGHSGKAHTYSTEDVLGTFHRLKLDGGTKWEELPGGEKMQGLALVAHGGKLYRIGGTQARNKPGDPGDLHSLKSCDCFDPKTGEWTKFAELPAGRSSHDAVVLGDRIYVVGGWEMTGHDGKHTWHDTALSIDLNSESPKWEPIKQPFQRRALTAVAYENQVYVIGGLAEDGVTKFVNVYDPSTKKWTEAPALPGNRINGFSAAACVLDGKLMINPADGSLYQLEEDEWKFLAELEHKRFVHRMVPAGNRLIVLGGASREGTVGETEIVIPSEIPAGE